MYDKTKKTLILILIGSVVVMSIVITYYTFMFFNRLYGQLENKQLSLGEIIAEVSKDRISLAIKTTEGIIQNKLAENSIKTGAEENTTIAKKTKDLLVSLETISTLDTSAKIKTNDFWVYVGSWKNNEWKSTDFSLSANENVSTEKVITLAVDTVKRDNYPLLKDTFWEKGRPMGILKKTESVKVKEIKAIDGIAGAKLIWVKGVKVGE